MSQTHALDADNLDWCREVGQLIDHIRLPGFPTMLATSLASHCLYDSLLIIAYQPDAAPVVIFPVEQQDFSPALQAYIAQMYRLDPLYQAIIGGLNNSIVRLRDLAGADFSRSDYFQKCYRYFDFSDEISLIVPLQQHTTCTVTLGRQSALGPITRSELRRLTALQPIVAALLRQYWQTQGFRLAAADNDGGLLQQALRSFGQSVLTAREREVAQLWLRGLSSRQISQQLNISEGTVKVHRKHIHQRLATRSPTDVFALFMKHLDQLQASKTT